MSRANVERRLIEVSGRLKAARQDLAINTEQLTALTDMADDLRIRSLVSETPLATREYQDAQRHADAMSRSLDELRASISDMERAQDELLDQLAAETD